MPASSMNSDTSPVSLKSTIVVSRVALRTRSSPFAAIHASVAASRIPPRQ